MPMLKFIGRGSCGNIKEGNNSAYIKRGEHLMLIDCGRNIYDRIKQSKLLKDIKHVHILITHFHDDHVGSLGSLIFHLRYELNIIPEIYFEDRNYLIKYLANIGVLEHITYTCMPSRRIDEMNIEFNAIETDHYAIFRPDYNSCYSFNQDDTVHMKNYFHCYGYFIQDKSNGALRSCYYSGDSKVIKNPIKHAVIAETIELYQDTCLKEEDGVAHMPLKKLCNIFNSEYRHNVYCMHLDSDELIEEAKKHGFNVVEVEV
jgi:ribonuclease BN (tRNA processing enzyme)